MERFLFSNVQPEIRREVVKDSMSTERRATERRKLFLFGISKTNPELFISPPRLPPPHFARRATALLSVWVSQWLR